MLKIQKLSREEQETLEEGFRNHPKPYFRNRSKSILLSAEGFTVKDIARIYQTRTRTVYGWIHRYEQFGFVGLMIRPGRGLKAQMEELSSPQIAVIKAEIERNPQSLREVSAILSEKFGFEITKRMLKKYLKKNSSTLGIGCESGLNLIKTKQNMPALRQNLKYF